MNLDQELAVLFEKVGLLSQEVTKLRNEIEVLRDDNKTLKEHLDISKKANFGGDKSVDESQDVGKITGEKRRKLKEEVDIAIAELTTCIDWLKKYL